MVQRELSSNVVSEPRRASLKLFVENASSLSSNSSRERELEKEIKEVSKENLDEDILIRGDEDAEEGDTVSVNEILSINQASASSDEEAESNETHINNDFKTVIDYFDTNKIEEIIESLHTNASNKDNSYIYELEEDVIIDENRLTKQNFAKPNKPESAKTKIVFQYPIIITFKKQKYNLFATDNVISEYCNFPILLKDRDLYNLSFEEFFPKLRAAFLKVGKPLLIAYEIFLNFQDLHLTLNEDNIYTTEIRLREIIMMFHNVNKNTNKLDTKDCVRIELLLHKRFSTCFNHIIDIAKGGKGFETLEKAVFSEAHEEQPIFIVDDDSDNEGHTLKTLINSDDGNHSNNLNNNLNISTNSSNYTHSANFIKKGKRKAADNESLDYLSDIEPDNILNFNMLKNSLEGINVFDKDYCASGNVLELSSSFKHRLIDLDSNEILGSKKSRNT